MNSKNVNICPKCNKEYIDELVLSKLGKGSICPECSHAESLEWVKRNIYNIMNRNSQG